MARTQLTGGQVKDGDITRLDINTTISGSALIRKVGTSDFLSIASTGVDQGTGDVTIGIGRSPFDIYVGNSTLTNYVLGTNVAITNADTIISAFGKVQGQLNAKGTGTVIGTGTSNRVTKWTAAGTIGDSQITDNGSVVSMSGNLLVGTAVDNGFRLRVNGGGYFEGSVAVPTLSSVYTYAPTNYVQGNNASLLAQTPMTIVWHDLFAFNKVVAPTFETSVDGIAWTTGTRNDNLFAQKENQAIVVLSYATQKAVRWTWNSSGLGFSSGAWLVIGHTYSNPAPIKTITFESSTDGVVWTNRHTSTYSTVGDTIFHYISSYGGDTRLRVTITIAASQTADIILASVKLLTNRPGNQGYGSEFQFPYTWDASQNMTVGGQSISAPRLISSIATGTAPLTIASTTLISNLNADLLDNQHGSYYLDYNNFTNKPTIPVVVPAALTKVDDTNVTITLGGTPATALLQGVSLTLGWTGTLADGRIASAVTWNNKENGLGNPSVNGYVLSSTTAGVRSWIPLPTPGGSGTVTSIAAGVGMNFTTITSSGSITLGTPSSLTDATTNSVSGTTHTHAITTFAASGTSPVSVTGGKVLGSAMAVSLNAAYGDTQNPYASKAANLVLASPNGAAGVPTFRALVAADIPALPYGTGTVTGTGAAGQVSFWTGANSQSGTNNFIWDNANLKITAQNPTYFLNTDAANTTNRQSKIVFQRQGVSKWMLYNDFGANNFQNFSIKDVEADVDRFVIRESGNIGIGVTNPLEKLEVDGTIKTTGARTSSMFNGNVALKGDAGGWVNMLQIVGNAGTIRGGFGALGGADNINYNFIGAAYNAPIAVFLPNGNVGIGTTSPQSKLEVQASTTLYDSVKSITLTHAEPTVYSGFIGLRQEGLAYSLLTFGTRSASTDYMETLNVGNGKVGIGTTAPSEKLEVNGAILASQSITIGSGGSIYPGSIYSNTNFGMYFRAKQASPALSQFSWVTAGGSDLMTIDPSGNVGIGTNSPQAKLHVENDLNSTSILAIFRNPNAGTSARNVVYWSNDLGHVAGIDLFGSNYDSGSQADDIAGALRMFGGGVGGIAIRATDTTNGTIRFYTGAPERMRIAANGNIGISTTNTPSKLTMAGALGGTVGAGGASLRIVNTDTGNYASIGAGIVGTTNSGMQFSVDGVSSMVISSGGNVGIGTTNPTVKLQVAGDITLGEGTAIDAPRNIKFDSNITISNSTLGGMRWFNHQWDSLVKASIVAITDGVLSKGALVFSTGDTGLNAGEKMRISSNGNVGIGINAPTQKLQVEGNLLVNGFVGSIDNGVPGGNKAFMIEGFPNAINSGYESGLSLKVFHYDGANFGYLEGLRILSDGRVGIGTTSPGVKLQIDGTGDASSNDLFRLTKPGGYGTSTFYQSYDNTYFTNGKNFNIKVEALPMFTLAIDNSAANARVIFPNGNVIIGTGTDNGSGAVLQVNGKTSGVAATASNHYVTKAQLDAAGRPYKVYTALLSQSGTNAPTAIVLENTLGGTVVWTRTGTGNYTAALTGAFTSNKTAFFINTYLGAYSVGVQYGSVNNFLIDTRVASTNTFTDGLLVGNTIEVRVYP